jgi:hypothetical protein
MTGNPAISGADMKKRIVYVMTQRLGYKQIKFRAAHPVRCFELNEELLGRPGVEPELLTAHCCHGIDMCGP